MNLAFNILCPFFIVGGLCLINLSNSIGQTMDYFYDPTFAPENIVGGGAGSVSSILVHEDGKYSIAGSYQFNWPFQIKKLVRFYNDGSHDESFSPPGNPLAVGMMQFFQDGYLVWLTNTVAQINDDNSYTYHFLDLKYAPYLPSAPPSPYATMYQIMDDNKIMVAGRFSPDTTELEDRRHLVRVHPDGSPDPSFEPLKCHEPLNARIIDFYPTPDDKWLITGEFLDIEGFESPGIARLNADFSVDTTFHSPFPDHTWNVRIIPGSHPQKLSGAIDEQNRMYVKFIDPGLAFPNPLFGLGHYRLLPNGSVDSTFQLGELLYLDYFGEWGDGGYYPGSIYTMAFEPDGSIIVGGKFRTIEGHPRGNIAKINENGSLMEGVFHRQGADTANWQNGNNPDIEEPHISRIVRLDNGGLMVGGRFSRYDGHDQWGVVRLMPSPVGIEDKAGSIKLACYPNPTKGNITIRYHTSFQSSTASLSIWNLNGHLIEQFSLANQSSNEIILDLNHLSPGIYIIRLISNNASAIEKLIIN